MTSRNVSTSLESRLSEHLAELVRDQPACGMSGPTFDVDIELDVEGCRTVTTQSYRNGTLVDWAPCDRRAAVVVRCPVEGLAQLTPGHSTTLHTGVDLALVDQCFPVDILRSLDGLSDPALSIANLSIDIEVNEVPGSPGPVRLEVGAGLMRVGRSDGVDPAMCPLAFRGSRSRAGGVAPQHPSRCWATGPRWMATGPNCSVSTGSCSWLRCGPDWCRRRWSRTASCCGDR